MPSREEIAYFGAGPSGLDNQIALAASQAFLNYENSGLGLAEISHRSPEATKILADTKAALTQILEIPDNYEIMLSHGGGSGQFSAIVSNMIAMWVEKRRREAIEEEDSDERRILERVRREVRTELRLDYILTGSWSLKASQEAAKLVEPLGKDIVNIVVDARKTSEKGKFDNIPEEGWNLTPNEVYGNDESAFVYYCDNETVDGVEFPQFPPQLETASQKERLIVADMSSNFLSRRVDVSKYAVIYGGAQKNIGITDLTFVIVRKDILTTQPSSSFLHAVGIWSPPTILHYPTLSLSSSLYNTMPIFSIWISSQIISLLLTTHSTTSPPLLGQELLSAKKSSLVYSTLSSYPTIYNIVPLLGCRSRMNICFRIKGGDEGKEKEFLKGAEERGLLGLKGHRSVGGVRASCYNAVGVEKVERLCAWLGEFAEKEGLK